ncbi:hypothetical protein KY290_016596 [Solanum tuberosum]|uniref:Uncharacterized protein n=1 Tax=Solanum tuberosum TaxID=4113 RepID=A0ABQ7VB05_SOLTU|nr:hypothetical protein KY284_015871 [Solanum tuberosum]KAH0760523.1 hypothetical protein KY290_016596 [Solanum tuberosum]
MGKGWREKGKQDRIIFQVGEDKQETQKCMLIIKSSPRGDGLVIVKWQRRESKREEVQMGGGWLERVL